MGSGRIYGYDCTWNSRENAHHACRCDPKEWAHATRQEDVVTWLERGLVAIDPDADPVTSVNKVLSDGMVRVYLEGYSDSFDYHFSRIRLSVPPVSEEEEQDTLRSIMEAMGNRRLDS